MRGREDITSLEVQSHARDCHIHAHLIPWPYVDEVLLLKQKLEDRFTGAIIKCCVVCCLLLDLAPVECQLFYMRCQKKDYLK